MRVVRSPDELSEQIELAQSESKKAFGKDEVFIDIHKISIVFARLEIIIVYKGLKKNEIGFNTPYSKFTKSSVHSSNTIIG